MHKGKTVYFWEQTVDDVNVYIPLPPKVPRKHQTAPLPPLPDSPHVISEPRPNPQPLEP